MLQELYSAAIALGLAAIALLTVLYLFYTRILVVFAWLLHTSFAVGGILSSSALLIPPLYGALAERAVENTGIPAQLREGDAFVRRVQTMPERILERVRHSFTTPELQIGPLWPPPPPPPPGALESSIVPLLEGFARTCLRICAFAVGIGLMCFGLLSRSRVDLVLAERELRARITELEAKRDDPLA
jgi:hypothetical protein